MRRRPRRIRTWPRAARTARRAASTCPSRSAPRPGDAPLQTTSSRPEAEPSGTTRSRTCTTRPVAPPPVNPARRRSGGRGLRTCSRSAIPSRRSASFLRRERPLDPGALEAVDVLVVVPRRSVVRDRGRTRSGSPRGAGPAPPAARRTSPPSAAGRRHGAPRTPSSRRRSVDRPGRRCRARRGRVEVEQVGAHVVQQHPVVAGQQHDPGQVPQERRQQVDRVVVEVVGRLVEQQAAGPGGHQRRQRQPGPLAAREGPDPACRLEHPESEPLGRLLGTPVGRPGVVRDRASSATAYAVWAASSESSVSSSERRSTSATIRRSGARHRPAPRRSTVRRRRPAPARASRGRPADRSCR